MLIIQVDIKLIMDQILYFQEYEEWSRTLPAIFNISIHTVTINDTSFVSTMQEIILEILTLYDVLFKTLVHY